MRTFLMIILGVFLTFQTALGQSKSAFQNKFLKAKDKMKEGGYAEAMTAFNELTYPNKNNQFVQMSMYYYGYCAWKQNDQGNARTMLNKLIKDNPKWKNIDDARFILADISFTGGGFTEGRKWLDEIESGKIKKQGKSMYLYYIRNTETVEELNQMLEQVRDDKIILNELVERLKRKKLNAKEKDLVEYLVQEYGIDRKPFDKAVIKKSEKKDVYKVAVMLPFRTPTEMNAEKLNPKYNKYYYMYQGMKMAVDSLAKSDIKIELYPFDTKRDSGTVAAILSQEEMKYYDLIIGCSWSKTSAMVSDFCEGNSVNYVNPMSSRGYTVDSNMFSYYFKPAANTIGDKAADYAIANFDESRPNVMIFYGEKEKDSIIAHTYKARMEAAGKTIICFEKVGKLNANTFDKELVRINRFKISHIMAWTENNFVGSHIMHPIEEYKIDCPVICPSKWLNIQLFDYEQMFRKQFHFIYPDYYDAERDYVEKFRSDFKEQLNFPPLEDRAYVGFDVMYIFGRILNQYGNLFNEDLSKMNLIPGVMSYGVRFGTSHNNQLVPILKFDEDYNFECVNQDTFRKNGQE